MLVDLTNMGVTGKEAEHILDEVSITANKNTIPFETQSPFITSGLRLGTPAVTSRGMKEDDMKEIAALIKLAICDKAFDEVKDRVAKLCEKYPLYK